MCASHASIDITKAYLLARTKTNKKPLDKTYTVKVY